MSGGRGSGVKRQWDDAQDARLRDLWLAEPSLSASAIALRMGRTKSSVIGRASRIGLPGRPSPLAPDSPSRVRVVAHLPAARAKWSAMRPATAKPAKPAKAPAGKALPGFFAAAHKPPTRKTLLRGLISQYESRERRQAADWQHGILHSLRPMPPGANTCARRCQWITGEAKNARREGRFCDVPSITGRSWCAEHAALVLQAPKADAPQQEEAAA